FLALAVGVVRLVRITQDQTIKINLNPNGSNHLAMTFPVERSPSANVEHTQSFQLSQVERSIVLVRIPSCVSAHVSFSVIQSKSLGNLALFLQFCRPILEHFSR